VIHNIIVFLLCSSVEVRPKLVVTRVLVDSARERRDDTGTVRERDSESYGVTYESVFDFAVFHQKVPPQRRRLSSENRPTRPQQHGGCSIKRWDERLPVDRLMPITRTRPTETGERCCVVQEGLKNRK